MRHLLTGAALIAVLAFAPPLGAQPANPSGGNAMGMPGPNPGGPGLTPYSAGPNPGGATLSGPRTVPAPAMAASAPPPSMSDTSSAMPPKHRASRHAAHGKAPHHAGRFPNLQGNVANQLNQVELSRLQSGNFTPPSPPEMSSSPGGPDQAGGTNRSSSNRMTPGGRPTSTRYGN
jgi:hypothetical protein